MKIPVLPSQAYEADEAANLEAAAFKRVTDSLESLRLAVREVYSMGRKTILRCPAVTLVESRSLLFPARIQLKWRGVTLEVEVPPLRDWETQGTDPTTPE